MLALANASRAIGYRASIGVIELFTRADADALDRTGEYLWRFRRELRHGPHGRDKYHFVAAMIFLTGLCAERRGQFRKRRARRTGEECGRHKEAARVMGARALSGKNGGGSAPR
jgi:hypothetical protein